MARDSKSVGFAVGSKDLKRLDRLARRFADRAARLRRIQSYGTQRAASRGIKLEDIPDVVERVLAGRGTG